MPFRRALCVIAACAVLTGSCGDTASPARASAGTMWPTQIGVEHQQWSVRVIRAVEHDSSAFTQGLERSDAGILESTGGLGASTLRRLDERTGEVLESRSLGEEFFGEGLTVVHDEIVQLTWTSEIAFRYDAISLEPIGTHSYAGEGWGLCFDGTDLWMSNGSTRLTRRDPYTFDALDDVEVRRNGEPVAALNELECIDGHVLANIWKSDQIVVIDPDSGVVEATVDATSLTESVPTNDPAAVLNGIADLGNGTLLLGGKLWPQSFVVELVATGAG